MIRYGVGSGLVLITKYDPGQALVLELDSCFSIQCRMESGDGDINTPSSAGSNAGLAVRHVVSVELSYSELHVTIVT